MSQYGLIYYNVGDLSLDAFFKYMSETGFEYAEIPAKAIWEDNLEESLKKAESVYQEMEALGLRISALSSGNDFVVINKDEIAQQVEWMKNVGELAKVLRTNIIRTEGGRPKPSVPEEKWEDAIVECILACLANAEKQDVYYAIDNHGYITNDGDLLLRVIQRVNSKRVGSNLDTWNYRGRGHDLKTVDRYYKQIAPYVLHTHLKDGKLVGDEKVKGALGEGEINFELVVKTLKDIEYSGVWCAEYEGDEDPLVGYAKCLQWMKKNI